MVDTKYLFADWLNNQNVRNQLKLGIKISLIKNGYPPQYSLEVFTNVMEQVENFEKYSETTSESEAVPFTYSVPIQRAMMVAEDTVPSNTKKDGD
nr:type I restriction enzyme endonuclease domain-containing protein [uncultured Peptostreptococcus sp.]